MSSDVSDKIIKKYIKVKWDRLAGNDPIIRWIDLGNGTLFRIMAYHVKNTFDMPREGFFVAIERIGAFFFRSDSEVSCEYVSEKLFLPEGDAAIMADWINTQTGNYNKQQGIYSARIISEVEHYNYAGEKRFIPLHPEIINEELTSEV